MPDEKTDLHSPDSRTGDRRTQRTRRQLRDALMTLILEKGYDAVTVEDITTRADLGRTTFYLHYRDKEELLLESIDAIANDLKAQVDLIHAAQGKAIPQPRPVHLAFKHAAENATLYRIILKGEGATRTATRLRRFISDSAVEFLFARLTLSTSEKASHFQEESAVLDPANLRLIADYFASSLLGFMTWWLEADMPYPPEQMADFFILLFFQGAGGMLGFSAQITAFQNASAAASGSNPPAPSA
jgi:AcrR family transcriptional regulator